MREDIKARLLFAMFSFTIRFFLHIEYLAPLLCNEKVTDKRAHYKLHSHGDALVICEIGEVVEPLFATPTLLRQ